MNRCHIAALSLSVLTLAASAGQASAQAVGKKPTLGVLAGLDLATLGGSDVSDAGSRTGLSIGGFATFHVTKEFGIEPELLFTQRGAKESGGGSDLTLKLDYIDIPVLARYDVTLPNSAARPFFLAGPTFSFQVSCDAEESGEGGSISASCDAVNQQNEGSLSKKSFDTGATLGAGVAFPVDKKMDLSFSVRYTHGLIDTFDNADAKNRTWSFMAGLTF
jgi:opacity protein-like surface antigen